jgi:ABC-type transport system involved in multi-copper enzyme maturation permease subunit
MKAKNVAMLLRKDLRMSVWVVLAGVIIWSLPMLFAWFGTWYFTDGATETSLRRVMVMGYSSCVMLSAAVMALIVSHILTAERMDRSAAFLAYVPFSRLEALMSKLVCALTLTAVFVGLDILLSTAVLPYQHHRPYDSSAFMLVVASIGVLVFGGTWLAGTCLRNGAVATVIGVGLPFILWMSVLAGSAGKKISDEDMTRIFMTAAISLGVAFFLAGLAVFMRRRPEA